MDNFKNVSSAEVGRGIVTNELSNTLKAWIIKNEAQYYKNISISITPVNVEIKDGKVEGTFTGTVSEMLKAKTPEELPAIRGMERFKDLKKGELSPNQISAVNKELSSWVTELKGYIGKTETLNIDFKVVADLSENGNILPETVNFFADNSMGDFYSGEGWENSYYNDNDMDFYTVHHYVTYCYASQPGATE